MTSRDPFRPPEVPLMILRIALFAPRVANDPKFSLKGSRFLKTPGISSFRVCPNDPPGLLLLEQIPPYLPCLASRRGAS